MKKIAAIFLLTTIGLSITGFFPVFKLLQNRIRKEIKIKIKQGVSEEELHKICFSEGDKIDWVREGREFRCNDQMFDIVKQEKENGRIVYLCINDKEEAQLFANLDALVKKQMDNDTSPAGKAAKNIIKMFSALKYISSDNNVSVVSHAEDPGCFIAPFPFSQVFFEIPTPPPNQVV